MPANVILVAEDNPDDALIFKMMFKRATLPHTLYMVEDGQNVIDWLSGKNEFADRTKTPLPEHILLDLKMPVKSGFEALEWIRSQEAFREISVAILSSSDDPRDVKRAFELGATHYFVKSPRLQDVMEFLRTN